MSLLRTWAFGISPASGRRESMAVSRLRPHAFNDCTRFRINGGTTTPEICINVRVFLISLQCQKMWFSRGFSQLRASNEVYAVHRTTNLNVGDRYRQQVVLVEEILCPPTRLPPRSYFSTSLTNPTRQSFVSFYTILPWSLPSLSCPPRASHSFTPPFSYL